MRGVNKLCFYQSEKVYELKNNYNPYDGNLPVKYKVRQLNVTASSSWTSGREMEIECEFEDVLCFMCYSDLLKNRYKR